MSTDLAMLAWVSGLTAVIWLPYVSARILRYGLIPALSYKIDDEPVAAWAVRAKKAHANAGENLVVFAALVLTAHIAGAANEATAAAAVVYFWARLAHFIVYTAGIPYLRTIAFTIAWLAQIGIFYQIVV